MDLETKISWSMTTLSYLSVAHLTLNITLC